jgi:uncharacterized protein
VAGRGLTKARATTVGLVSDTHGLVRPEALAALRGVDVVIHAGDIGAPDVLDAFAELAPVTAVRGNNDRGAWARRIPETVTATIAGVVVHVVHDRHELAIDPEAAGVAVVVSGHSHRPVVERRGGVLWVNPGSAGPRRFSLPVSVARLVIADGRIRARLVPLRVLPPVRARR